MILPELQSLPGGMDDKQDIRTVAGQVRRSGNASRDFDPAYECCWNAWARKSLRRFL
jgi:hypothetical protein